MYELNNQKEGKNEKNIGLNFLAQPWVHRALSTPALTFCTSGLLAHLRSCQTGTHTIPCNYSYSQTNLFIFHTHSFHFHKGRLLYGFRHLNTSWEILRLWRRRHNSEATCSTIPGEFNMFPYSDTNYDGQVPYLWYIPTPGQKALSKKK